MSVTLSSHHKDTYDAIFRHPTPHNLEWRKLVAMFDHLGEVEPESNGKQKFIRNGQTLSLTIHGKDVPLDEVVRIRHFLEHSSYPLSETSKKSGDWVVVLDHAGARIYGSDSEPLHVEPIDPSGHDQHVHNPRGDSGGQQGPHRKQFYEDLAQKLSGAERIVLVGDGQGSSSEIDRFVSEVKHQHGELSARIIGKESLDLHHLSEGELLDKARKFFD